MGWAVRREKLIANVSVSRDGYHLDELKSVVKKRSQHSMSLTREDTLSVLRFFSMA